MKNLQFYIFVFCCATFVVQQGESITPIWVVGSSTTVSLGGLIAGGLLLKAGAAAVFGLVHVCFTNLPSYNFFVNLKLEILSIQNIIILIFQFIFN